MVVHGRPDPRHQGQDPCLGWIGFELYRRGGTEAAVSGLLFILALFLCVLLHEFGHALAARSFGIRTPMITLLPIGGLASIERIPKKPTQEIFIAVAGPLVNVVIVAVLWLTRSLGPPWQWNITPTLEEPLPLTQQLLIINIMLVLFNMLPVFPMDGGRVFRALLAFALPWAKATEIAALIGQSLAILGGILAISAGNIILLLIAIFIFFVAGAEAQSARTDGLLSGLTALQAAEREFHTLRPDQPLSDAIDFLLDSPQQNYPVVDETGACVGILTQSGLMSQLSNTGPESKIGDAMHREFPRLQPDMPALEALRTIQQVKLPAAPLFAADGELTHWFTLDNLADVVLTQTALRQYSPDASVSR